MEDGYWIAQMAGQKDVYEVECKEANVVCYYIGTEKEVIADIKECIKDISPQWPRRLG